MATKGGKKQNQNQGKGALKGLQNEVSGFLKKEEKEQTPKERAFRTKKERLQALDSTADEALALFGGSGDAMPAAGGKKIVFGDSGAPVSQQTSAPEPPSEYAADLAALKREQTFDEGWWSVILPLAKPEDGAALTVEQVTTIYNKARAVYTEALGEHKLKQKSSKDVDWLDKVSRTGTLSDRIAAVSMLISQDPVYSLHHLATLVSMSEVKGRRERSLGMTTLREIFQDRVMPPRRKLTFFKDQAINHPQVMQFCGVTGKSKKEGISVDVTAVRKCLIYWYFEDSLKQKYLQFVTALQKWSNDEMTDFKSQSINVAFNLLLNVPEQERVLLSMTVNKLGDPDVHVASHVMRLILKLVEIHPNMKSPVATEIEALVLRQGTSLKSQYYAITALRQIPLDAADATVALRLIRLYFMLFKKIIGVCEIEARLMGAILAGLNRAFQGVAVMDDEEFDCHMDDLFKIVHVTAFATSVQALTLIFQVLQARRTLNDRFYRTLYKRLGHEELRYSSKHVGFLNLVLRAMRADSSLERVRAFIKRLLQITPYLLPNAACGVLMIVDRVVGEKQGLWGMIIQPEDDDVETFKDADKATPEKPVEDSSDDEATQQQENGKGRKGGKPGQKSAAQTSLIPAGAYDPFNIEPLRSNAGKSCLWELNILSRHTHPSVAKFAQSILIGESIYFNGDPIQDFTVIRFLDRFAFKNAEQKERHLRTTSVFGFPRVPAFLSAVDPKSEDFLNERADRIDEHEMVFHKFYNIKRAQRQEREKKTGKKETRLEEEEEEGANFGGMDALDEDMDDDQFADILAEAEESESKKKKNKKKAQEEETEEPELEEASAAEGSEDEGEFDYSDLDESAFVDSDEEADVDPTKLRPEQLIGSDDEEEDDAALFLGDEDEFDMDAEADEDQEEEPLEQMDDDKKKKRGKKGKKESAPRGEMPLDTFASAEDFENLLNDESAKPNAKQLAWQSRFDGKGRKRQSGKQEDGPKPKKAKK